VQFNPATDIAIFDELFKKRPELNRQNLIADIQRYYLPYAEKLVVIKQTKNSSEGVIIGVSAIQGAGKSTQGEILEVLLKHLGHSAVSRSIDDHYITHAELSQLRQSDPRYIRRGVTHDIPLALSDLTALQQMQNSRPILVSGYDKAVHHGDGDRLRWVNLSEGVTLTAQVLKEELTVNKTLQSIKAIQLASVEYNGAPVELPLNMGSDIPLVDKNLPAALMEFLNHQSGSITITSQDSENAKFSGVGEMVVAKKQLPNAWRLITQKPDFIFYDGWMLGARPVEDESVFSSGLPALEKTEDQAFARDVNQRLADYAPLWQLFSFVNVLYVHDYQVSIKWRDQAEEALRQKGQGMSHEEITEFVHYFWRSVHPAIQIKNLAHESVHTQQVVIINDDHSVGDILTPEQAKQQYP